MRFSVSRRQVWERLPRKVKDGLGRCLGWIPPAYALGGAFRRQLAFVNEAQWWSAERSREYQVKRLRQICQRAYTRTPYYRAVFDRIGFRPEDIREPGDIRRLPLIDRHALRTHLTEMCAVPPTSGRVDYVSTGGTSGEPLGFYIGVERSAVEYAHLVSAWTRAGYRLDLPMAVFRGRLVPLDSSGLHHAHDPLLRHHFYSSFHLTDDSIRGYLDHVRTLGPCFLHVYPSSVAALARSIRRTGIVAPRNVLGIIAESEIVYPEQRRMVEEVFGCRYFSGYGMTEKVVAAAECEKSSDYHVWPTYGFFELLDEQGHPITTPGRRGEIAGTGFINEVVPFIRYRTGDQATYVGDRCAACGREQMIVKDIRGHRIQESLVASDGTAISWTAVNLHDDTFDHVLRFQFRQERAGHAVLRLVRGQGFSERDLARIRQRVAERLQGRLTLDVELADQIALSKSGKAIYVDQRLEGLEALAIDRGEEATDRALHN